VVGGTTLSTPASTRQALILFAHGAREASWRAPFDRLHALLCRQQPQWAVRLAFLETMTPDLPTVVAELAHAGHRRATVVPVFLGQGGHLQRDLPRLVLRLQSEYPQLRLAVAAALGDDAQVLAALAAYCQRCVAPD
jgi:sirohydrochlorin cobaltochelatase